jgi:hypothetical protein
VLRQAALEGGYALTQQHAADQQVQLVDQPLRQQGVVDLPKETSVVDSGAPRSS